MDFSTFVGLYLIMRLHSERNSIFRDSFSKSIFSYSFEDSDLNPFAVSSGKPCPKRNRSLFYIWSSKKLGAKNKIFILEPPKNQFFGTLLHSHNFLKQKFEKRLLLRFRHQISEDFANRI